MSDNQPSSASKDNFSAELVSAILGGAILAAFWYFGTGLLHKVTFLQRYGNAITAVQEWGAILLPAFALLGITVDQIEKAKARKASQKVTEALDKIAAQTPGLNIAEISTKDVAELVKGAKIAEEKLGRLVEQGKQRLLIDDKYLLKEISPLIVEYLQPLPRNAKRFMNRFRVNLLIAARRGLLTSEAKVTAKQVGKWLVLMERWPQLGHSLSADPEKMKKLEETEGNPALTQPPSPQTVSSSLADPFMESIKTMAPSYIGDEDLRRFIKTAPALAAVMQRLANFGMEQPFQPGTAAPSPASPNRP